MALGQKKPADHISRYKTLSVRDENGQIIGYKNNPEYASVMPENDPILAGDPMDNLKFSCTKYPERVYDDVFCEYKGDKGVGACEDCQYLVTEGIIQFTEHVLDKYPVCAFEQLIVGEDSECVYYHRRISFEECLDCPNFEPHTKDISKPNVKVKEPIKKPVEPLTDLEIMDLIGETGLEIS